jgi:hypothetical protein
MPGNAHQTSRPMMPAATNPPIRTLAVRRDLGTISLRGKGILAEASRVTPVTPSSRRLTSPASMGR